MPSKVELPFIHVVWIDSCHVSGWMFLQNFAKEYKKEELMQETAGFLLRETEYSLMIVQSKGLYWSKENEDFAIDSIMEIPKCAIHETNYLTKKKKHAKIDPERQKDRPSRRRGQVKEAVSKKR